MKRKYVSHSIAVGLLAMVCSISTSCGSDDEEQLPKGDTPAFLDGKMIKLTNNLGDWDEAVMYAQDGYALYKSETIDDSDIDFVQIQSPNSEYDCGIYSNSQSSLPELLILDNETYSFYNQGDSVIEVSRSTEDGFESLYSVAYTLSDETRASKATTITYLNRDDKVKRVAKALDAILSAGADYTTAQLKKLKKALDDISIFYYYEHVEDILDSLNLCRETYGETGDSVIYCFTQYAKKVKIKKYDPVKYTLSIHAKRATNIKTHSASIKGRIVCISDKYSKLGKWGVIYSENHDSLTLEKAKVLSYANTDSGRDFKVKIMGLKANTTYYYKVFYKFNSKKHEDLRFRYGDPDAQSYVDPWYGSFTTAQQFTCPDNKHPHMIDLGLPSGTKWACCNLGASAPNEVGSYYRWAETSNFTGDYNSTYPFKNTVFYDEIDGTSWDAATVWWGAPWRMPTYDQFIELINNTRSRLWTEEIDKVTHTGDSVETTTFINGLNFIGHNGNIIFMPAAGQYTTSSSVFRRGTAGYYWSSTPIKGGSAFYSYAFVIDYLYLRFPEETRGHGCSIRPVVMR